MVIISNGGSGYRSATRRSWKMQRVMASSPTVKPPQQRLISSAWDTTPELGRARATSTCITRGCST
jgi:hypothetical protein